jgi:hypothetical protein
MGSSAPPFGLCHCATVNLSGVSRTCFLEDAIWKDQSEFENLVHFERLECAEASLKSSLAKVVSVVASKQRDVISNGTEGRFERNQSNPESASDHFCRELNLAVLEIMCCDALARNPRGDVPFLNTCIIDRSEI